MKKCIFCDENIVNSVHIRWCIKNPNLEENRKKHAQKISIGASERTKKAWKSGKMKNIVWKNNSRPHTEATKELIRQKALLSNHRRLLKSTKEYERKDGTKVLLDSSWEIELAKRLDNLNIEWSRPSYIFWTDSKGNKRKYFPDFYLPKYDLYLDPKNNAAWDNQIEKITWLLKNVKNLIFLRSLKDVKDFFPE